MRKNACCLSLLLFGSGCAGVSQKQQAYIAASVTKNVVEEAHAAYSRRLNARVDECTPEKNESIDTVRKFDECLGPYAHNQKVVLALGIYRTAAVTLFELLRESETSDTQQVLAAKRRVLEAAFELLSLMPEAQPYVEELQEILDEK